MGHDYESIGHSRGVSPIKQKARTAPLEDFVLEKSIFNNVFEKDIRRVFIYKKAERLAKAIHLIAPAFSESQSLKNRMDEIAIGLVDAAIVPSSSARAALSRELLALSSALSMAQTGGFLSAMNTELIAREAHTLLQEVAGYEEPRLFLEEAPTLASIARSAQETQQEPETPRPLRNVRPADPAVRIHKGHHKKDTGHVKDRIESILSVIRSKGQASIKDISTLIRGVSEKTIQRELSALIESGVIERKGERRWSVYSLAG